MKILIKENVNFGGYVGWLVDDREMEVHLPMPFNVGATHFTGKHVKDVIRKCVEEAELVFEEKDLEVIYDYYRR